MRTAGLVILGIMFACNGLAQVAPANDEQVAILTSEGGSLLPGPEADGYMVGVREIPTEARAASNSHFHGAPVSQLIEQLGVIVAHPSDPIEFRHTVAQDSNVLYVEENLMDMAFAYTTNDPSFSNQYALDNARLDSVWDRATGTTSSAVCIIDSGVRTSHQDLSGARYLGGRDILDNDATPQDDLGHGTHVAGIAVGSLNNNLGIASPGNLGYYAVRIGNSFAAISEANVAAGITWCADNTIAKTVLSLSLAGTSGSTTLQNAVNYAYTTKGKLVVAATGNNGGAVGYPAAYSNVIAVSCINSNNNLACNSNTGPEVDVAAPGDFIYSTCRDSDTSYCYMTGTSMATPLVSGTAALLWGYQQSLTAAQLGDAIRFNADDIGAAGFDNNFGWGKLDAECMFAGNNYCDPPQNDKFNRPHLDLDGLVMSISDPTDSAGMQNAEPSPCGQLRASVWYTYRPKYSGILTIDTFGSTFDTVLAAYTGASLDSLNNVACNDDTGGLNSQVSFPVQSLEEYSIQAGGYNGATGGLHIDFTLDPDQADCGISGDAEDSFGSGRLITAPKDCGGILAPGDVDWYRWNVPLGRSINVYMASQLFYDFDMCLYNPSGVLVTCSTNSGALAEQIRTLPVTTAGLYGLRIYGHQSGDVDSYTLNVHNCLNPAGPCADDPIH